MTAPRSQNETGRRTLAEANALSVAEFVAAFGGVLEHSPRYAERVAQGRPYPTAEALALAFGAAARADDEAGQLALIRAHPDLAGKAARAGALTAESAAEQASAGLDRLSEEEYAEFHRLNAAYHERFGLPFVACVREHTRASILRAAAERLTYTPEQERAAALHEIGRIARLRALDLLNVEPQQMVRPLNVRLGENSYGKAEVHVMRVRRNSARHEVHDLSVRVALRGEFGAAHLRGDNAGLLATDTMRNTVYALAKTGFAGSIEDFGRELISHFVQAGPQVTGGTVEFTQHLWARLPAGEAGHDHAFTRLGHRRTARVDGDGQRFTATSGLEGLELLKTTGSGWAGYLLDEPYTTLPEAHDRLMATSVTARWEYGQGEVDHDAVWARAHTALVRAFPDHYSPSLQYTLARLGEAVLDACPEVSRVWLRLPNRHHLPYNLARFGLQNDLEVFHVDPEPYGLMEAWVERP